MKSTLKMSLALAAMLVASVAWADGYNGPLLPQPNPPQYSQHCDRHDGYDCDEGVRHHHRHHRDDGYEEPAPYPLPPPIVVAPSTPIYPVPSYPVPAGSACLNLPPPNPALCRIVKLGPYNRFGVFMRGRIYPMPSLAVACQRLCDLARFSRTPWGPTCY